MPASSRAALVAAILCAAAAPVFADAVYTYHGAPLSVVTGPPLPDDTLQIVLDFSDDGTTLLDWSSSVAGVGTIARGDHLLPGALGDPDIELRTDASGQVLSWAFYVSTGYGAPDPAWPDRSIYSVRFTEPDGQPYSYESVYRTTSRDDYEAAFYANGPAAGAWTFSRPLSDLAFANVVPEPSAGSLMAVGLLCAAWFGRGARRSRPRTGPGAGPRRVSGRRPGTSPGS